MPSGSKSLSNPFLPKIELNLEPRKVRGSSSEKMVSGPSHIAVKMKRVPKRIVPTMTQNGAWSLTGMSTLLGRDTTAGQQACKRRRLESEPCLRCVLLH